MSKKYKNRFRDAFASPSPTISHEHAGEYNIIKWDLIRLGIFNAIVLAAVLTVYYTNQQSQYLERWFSQYIKF